MSYEHDELEMIAEALMRMARRYRHDPKKQKAIEALADKVVKDQADKACA